MHPIFLTIKFKIAGMAIGPFTIYWYGVILVIAFILAFYLFYRRTCKAKILSKDDILDLGTYLLIFGLLGARLLWVLINFKKQNFIDAPLEIINLRAGGLSWHGALLGGLLVAFWFSKKKKINFGKLLDLLSPSFVLGLAIGRIGCFLGGCCGGIKAKGVLEKFYTQCFLGGNHPAQIYEFFLDLIILWVLFKLEKKIKFNGELYLFFLLLYSLARFSVDYFRIDTIPLGIFSLAQIFSLLVILICGFLILKLRFNGR
ncbi:MAG: prolipoprotein diacylglyceryl transferase [Armatimonadetes bacterium]|nr:prolipoprotein diacylglyceryl transferase [Armatimonadota bacterium]